MSDVTTVSTKGRADWKRVTKALLQKSGIHLFCEGLTVKARKWRLNTGTVS